MTTSTEQFFGAWGEAHAAARVGAVRAAMTDAATYADPRTPEPLTGADAVTGYVGMFVEMAPGAQAVVIKSDTNGASERATIAFRMADGKEQLGQYFIDHDGDKIVRMVGYVGTGA
ncbi:hypothetical protein [Thalassobium sp. R2A62]|uniref:hypothetical protein n=1 Tax=Thalassobium sp. R2A62 TaxID=633131 RepID=UPI0001B1D1B2|nr:hypothetical protein [Thalassobium sp. R2A62]EET46878.1 GroEL, putative [Thalassobium sp. R2A62]